MNKICMKNKIVFFLAVIVSFFTINVNAEELNTLYPVDSVISIQTKNFSYSEMKFNSGVKDRNGYPVISFGSITNNSKSTKPIPISIDILMFDSGQENIGFITYCSEKDLDTDYSGAVIRQKESLPFNLSIVKKLANLECGADCVSLGEIKRAILAGIPKYKIIANQKSLFY